MRWNIALENMQSLFFWQKSLFDKKNKVKNSNIVKYYYNVK